MKPSNYPEPFFSRMAGARSGQLGDVFGLKNFGVNLTRLAPGGESALLHRHSKQDEFVYILQGRPTLVTDAGEAELSPGMCAGFPAQGIAHQLVNRTGEDVVYLEIGDRTPGDEGSYPADDLQASSGLMDSGLRPQGRPPLLSGPLMLALRPNDAAQGVTTSICTVMLRSSVAFPGRIGTGMVGGGGAAAKAFIRAVDMSARATA